MTPHPDDWSDWEDLYERLIGAKAALYRLADDAAKSGNALRQVEFDSKARGVDLALSYMRDYDRL